MQLVAKGAISLDDHAHRYVDPMLKRGGYRFKSMEEIFRPSWDHSGPSFNASNITVRELMHMDSGIKDYDTDAFRDFQYRHGGVTSPRSTSSIGCRARWRSSPERPRAEASPTAA
ncbi:unnamed protein product [Prorocentrum cordatum]|uniref:Beta-lactamase-related domain-containing protein n=1 Tax=Prorocentrum cordatum TaxID=2364126 RepID=A0ABN9QTW3_9DINO|nr:unnamed protein product [Polarella glacialis]